MKMKPPPAAPAPTSTSIAGVTSPAHLKPLSFIATLLLFAIPATVFSVSLLVVLPILVRHGMSYFVIFNLCFGTPLGLMLGSAFIGYRLERRPFTWPAIRDRFRLGKLSLSGWLWTVGLIAFLFISDAGVGYFVSVARLRGLHIFTWPPEFARFEAALEHIGRDFLGIPLPGHYWVLLWYTAFLIIFNVLGEELWWRGYILPRQELSQGGWTWVIHGVLWALFHFFYYQSAWDILPYLPITCSIAFVCQRVKSTWPGVIAHTVSNAGLPVAILVGVLGKTAG